MPRILRSPLAESDLLEIWLFIAGDNPEAADATLDRIDKVCSTLARSPRRGRHVPNLDPRFAAFPLDSILFTIVVHLAGSKLSVCSAGIVTSRALSDVGWLA
jgi:toxin ParE1/3/4